jgi:hypothetical protein
MYEKEEKKNIAVMISHIVYYIYNMIHADAYTYNHTVVYCNKEYELRKLVNYDYVLIRYGYGTNGLAGVIDKC